MNNVLEKTNGQLSKVTMSLDLKKLSYPIDSIKWRIQSCKNGKAICIPYIDARDAMDRLDEVCGIAGWQSRHKEEKGNLFCEVGIIIDGQWIWKSDVGVETNMEKEKGEASDSFKRACVMWGIGRFLYRIDPVIIESKEYKNGKEYPYIKERNQFIFKGDTLTRYINWLRSKK